MNGIGWSRGLEVTGGGTGVVSHAGLVLLRGVTDRTGLTGGLSKALASGRLLRHDRGRVLADLACAIADGAEVISDFRVMRDQREVLGPVASVPVAWRTLEEVASGGARTQRRVTAAVNAARRVAWAQAEARHGALPGVPPRPALLGPPLARIGTLHNAQIGRENDWNPVCQAGQPGALAAAVNVGS